MDTSISMRFIYCLLVFCIASFTDFLDGAIARKYNLITTFGKFLDPIADKLLVNSAFILLAFDHTIPVVFVIVMIARDTIVDAMRMMCANKGVVVAARMSGKAKTVLQMSTVIFALLHEVDVRIVGMQLYMILLWLAMFASVYSGISYFQQMKTYVMESK